MPLLYDKKYKERARELRSNMTDAERELWSRIRRKQILGAQFYRQKPIGSYIVDFYCPKARLVLEVDGGQHWESDHAERDQQRDLALEQLGLEVLRFSNRDVLKRSDAVVETIYKAVRKRLPSPL